MLQPVQNTVTEHPATLAERVRRGRDARARYPLAQHAELVVAPDRVDPVELLESQNRDRLPELVGLRSERMSPSAFTFFRGAALVMTADLAAQPHTGLTVQLCGDAHLSNFGVFGTPERRLNFDINDFDETHPGPWEWDVKRLAASLAVAGRDNGFSRSQRRKVIRRSVEAYREAMRDFAGRRTLDVWYASVDLEHSTALQDLRTPARARTEASLLKARQRDSRQVLDRLTAVTDGKRHFLADPPLLVPARDLLAHVERRELESRMRILLECYRQTLPSDRQHLLDQFRFVDLARSVGGIGSVGTRCWLVLLEGRDEADPLFLQVKEAQESVLGRYLAVDGDAQPDRGTRVVAGQRLMQSASDIFLGWHQFVGPDSSSRDFYVRQFRDWKLSAKVERMQPHGMAVYGRLCGWTLAKAHARSGDRVAIAAYLGGKDTFDCGLVEFAELYADQNERDFARFTKTLRPGA